MINDPISRLALFNNTGLSKADDTAKADDISAFNQLLKSSKDDSSPSSRSFGAGNGYDNNIDSKSLLKAARAAADKMVDADAAAIAQRVENHKDSVRAESAASAVKKVTEVFKEIKF